MAHGIPQDNFVLFKHGVCFVQAIKEKHFFRTISFRKSEENFSIPKSQKRNSKYTLIA